MTDGGYFATGKVMLVTYVVGWFFTLTGWLSDAWTHVTPGQAALLLGLLTYGTHHAPKLSRLPFVRRLFNSLSARARAALRGGVTDGKKELLFFTALTVVLFLAGVCALALVFHVSP